MAQEGQGLGAAGGVVQVAADAVVGEGALHERYVAEVVFDHEHLKHG